MVHGAEIALPDGETRQAPGVVLANLTSAVPLWPLRLEARFARTASTTAPGNRRTGEALVPGLSRDAAALSSHAPGTLHFPHHLRGYQ